MLNILDIYYNYNMKIKIIFFILLLILPSHFLFCNEIDTQEVLNIIENINERIFEIGGTKPDKKLEQIMDEMKTYVNEYAKFNKNIPVNDDKLISIIDKLDDRVKKLRYFNVDDELFVMIYYLRKQISKVEKKETKIDMDKYNSELDKLLEDKENDEKIAELIDLIDSEKLVKYLLMKILKLEEEIKLLREKGVDVKKDDGYYNELIKEVNEKLKSLEDLESKLEELVKEKTEEEIINIIKELEIKDEMIKAEIDKIIEERKKEKKILLNPINKNQYGQQFALQASLGLTGIYTTVTVGVLFPKIINLCTMSLYFNFGFAIPGTLVAENYRSAFLGGSYYISFSSPVFSTNIRVYGALEFMIGTSLSTTGSFNVLGNNITLGGYAVGGMEFYFISQLAFFIEAGGGVLFLYSLEDESQIDTELRNAIAANNNNGTGVRLNFGLRLYFARNKK